ELLQRGRAVIQNVLFHVVQSIESHAGSSFPVDARAVGDAHSLPPDVFVVFGTPKNSISAIITAFWVNCTDLFDKF
ncbi:MAG TPA: hypothetical protein PLR57_06730, partial [Clostridia bacterium]|nr:hypothetical protein [Clostridia bacterium]